MQHICTVLTMPMTVCTWQYLRSLTVTVQHQVRCVPVTSHCATNKLLAAIRLGCSTRLLPASQMTDSHQFSSMNTRCSSCSCALRLVLYLNSLACSQSIAINVSSQIWFCSTRTLDSADSVRVKSCTVTKFHCHRHDVSQSHAKWNKYAPLLRQVPVQAPSPVTV